MPPKLFSFGKKEENSQQEGGQQQEQQPLFTFGGVNNGQRPPTVTASTSSNPFTFGRSGAANSSTTSSGGGDSSSKKPLFTFGRVASGSSFTFGRRASAPDLSAAKPVDGEGRPSAGKVDIPTFSFSGANASIALLAACKDSDFDKVDLLLSTTSANVNYENHDHERPILTAVEKQNLKILQRLLEQEGADVNFRGPRSTVPLHMAAANNSIDIMRCLLKAGAEVEQRHDENGETAVMISACLSIEGVQLLVEHGANVNAKRNDGATAMHDATFSNKLDIVSFLIANGVDPSLPKSSNGVTPLHLAVQSDNHMGVVEVLLADSRVRIDQPAFDDRTALFCACNYGAFKVTKLLIQRGASVDVTDDRGHTPLLRCIGGFANAEEGIEIAKLLEEKGASLTTRTKDGNSALEFAIDTSRAEFLKMLLERKVFDVNPSPPSHAKNGPTVTHSWLPPLSRAVYAGNFEVFKALLDAGADPQGKDFNRNPEATVSSPIFHAVRVFHSADMILELARRGVDVLWAQETNGKGENGRFMPPIAHAITVGQRDAVEVFLKLGFPANDAIFLEKRHGTSLLQGACEVWGGAGSATLLLDREVGKQEPVANASGQTPLSAAALRRNVELIKLLFIDNIRHTNADIL